MIFPKDHFQHNYALEWWYFWGKIDSKEYFHHSLFKIAIGKEQRLILHTSLNGDFLEVEDDEVYDYEYRTGYYGNSFRFNNCFFYATVHPISDTFIHRKTRDWVYYSIPFLEGKTSDGRTIEAWFDHEYGYLPDFNKIKNDLLWDWNGIKYNDYSFRLSATGKYNISCEIEPMKDEHVFINPEIIFHPKFGPNYSEQPFLVVRDGKEIGYGMRERTYRRS